MRKKTDLEAAAEIVKNTIKQTEPVPNRLYRLRMRSRLTRNEVRLLSGFSVQTITRHESGVSHLTGSALAVYAKIYKIAPGEIFSGPPIIAPPWSSRQR